MRHRTKRGKLSRTSSHRKALMKSLCKELFFHGRIVSTVEKAKAARPFAEKMVTLAKRGGLANYRRVIALLGDKAVAKKLFEKIAPTYSSRPGGYTRIVRLSTRRLGDAGSQAIFELVGNASKGTQDEGTKSNKNEG